MTNITANLLPIIISTILSFVMGAIWYGPLFGKKWMELNGFNEKDLEKENQDKNVMMKKYGITFISALIMNIIIAMHMGAFTSNIAIPAALLNSLALVGLGTLPHYLFESKKFSHWLINAGYTIVMVIIAAACISLF